MDLNACLPEPPREATNWVEEEEKESGFYDLEPRDLVGGGTELKRGLSLSLGCSISAQVF